MKVIVQLSTALFVVVTLFFSVGCDGMAGQGNGRDGERGSTMGLTAAAQKNFQRPVPDMDRNRPARVETATFALG